MDQLTTILKNAAFGLARTQNANIKTVYVKYAVIFAERRKGVRK